MTYSFQGFNKGRIAMDVSYVVNGVTYADEKAFRKALKEAKKEERIAQSKADMLYDIARANHLRRMERLRIARRNTSHE
jgi:hypothetical protein